MKNSTLNRYDESFKFEAIELFGELKNYAEVARRLGIHVNTVRKWVHGNHKVNNDSLKKSDALAINKIAETDTIKDDTNTDIKPSLKDKNEDHTIDVDTSSASEYETLYHKAKIELETQFKLNAQLSQDLKEAQAFIGKLIMEINKNK